MSTNRLFEPKEPLPSPGAWLAAGLPELTLAVLAWWIMFAPAHVWRPDTQSFMFGLMADAGLLMASATLIDLASRLRKPPPWWVAVLLPLAASMFFPEVWSLIVAAFEQGWLVLAVFLWSLIERVREIWTLPKASRLEKYRRRTLVFDRLYTGLVLGGATTVGALLAYAIWDLEVSTWSGYLLALVGVFYAINTYNAWRVYQPRFAARPRSLWPWIDGGGIQDLSPI